MKAPKRAFGLHLQMVFGTPTESQGVVTVAWITPAPGVLHLGFSFCSPSDPWCKAKGRDMALARLLERTGPTVAVPFLYDAKRTVHEVARAVLSHDFGRLAALSPGVIMWERVPSWTKNLGKKMEERERVIGGRIRRLKVPPIPTHAADAFAFMAPFFDPPRKGDITFISTPRQVKDLFSKYCVEEPAEISFREWERLNKVLKMGTLPRKPTPNRSSPA